MSETVSQQTIKLTVTTHMADETDHDESELQHEKEFSSRLDKYLTQALSPVYSRERIQQLIETGCVSVENRPIKKPSFTVKTGQTLQLSIPDNQPLQLAAENIPLTIVYEDSDLLVVHKPKGMLTHPSGKETTGTLVNALLHHCQGSLSGINGIIRPGIVHRLDRDTSGLLVVAKTDQAHRNLAEQIKAKTARREYVAIAQGVFKQTTGSINAPIGRNPKQRDKMCITYEGRPAVTHWEIIETIGEQYSMVRLKLETGRTHQIRVHLAHVGHPVVGDILYGTGLEKNLKLPTQGQCLQAVLLSFIHPTSQEAKCFEIQPEQELLAIWETLQARWQ